MVGAVQGASCYGPAYEHAMIMDHELRKCKIRDRVPMTFVTPESYIGHLGLGGVGDTKGFIERDETTSIRWITNARSDNVNWSSDGRWVQLAKVAFEKYFLQKIKRGSTEPVFEKLLLRTMGLKKIK